MDQVSGFVRIDGRGRILACNPASLRILGLASEQRALGVDFWSLAGDPEVRDRIGVLIRDAGRAENVEITSDRQDGSTLCLLANVVGQFNVDGGIEHLDLQLIDISEKRKIEQQWGRVQRMEALGRLACGVAHDFNNLLTAILCYTESLAGSLPENTPQQEEIQQIRRAGEKGAALTRQLLTFARGKVSDVTIVDLNEMVKEILPLVTQLIGRRVDLVLDFARDLKPIRIDKSQLEQAILNLAINARDAMEGTGTLTLRTLSHRVERPFVLHHDRVLPGDYSMLAVRDTGTGIKPQIMDHLFEPFFTTKEEGKGTGLGLSTVYGTVKQHGGFISVYNEAEGGVTFKVSFPSVEDEESMPPQATEPPAARDRTARTVLLAEDDAEVRSLIANALRARGFAALSARDGQHALELLACHPAGVRLLLSDVSMPRLDGLELARRFAELRPAVPILLFSGTAKEDALIVDVAGPVSFLEKPFTMDRLLEKIENLL